VLKEHGGSRAAVSRTKRGAPQRGDPPTVPTAVMEYLQILAGVAVIIGGAFALYQFQVARADLRVERTLRLVERFEGDAYLTAQGRAAAISARASEQIDQIDADPVASSLPAKVLADERQRLIVASAYETVDGQSDLSSSILLIVGFFGGVSVCVDRGVCDGDTAHQFLDPYATEFWHTFYPVIVFERANSRPNFAKEMEAFVSQAKDQ